MRILISRLDIALMAAAFLFLVACYLWMQSRPGADK